jgi:hypothetical protein
MPIVVAFGDPLEKCAGHSAVTKNERPANGQRRWHISKRNESAARKREER